MPAITIPKNFIKKDDLVIIPRKEYEELLRAAAEKKKRAHATQLDKDLDESIAEYRAGKYFGPFDNARDLMKSLKSKK